MKKLTIIALAVLAIAGCQQKHSKQRRCIAGENTILITHFGIPLCFYSVSLTALMIFSKLFRMTFSFFA